jgi:hypothetical protein
MDDVLPNDGLLLNDGLCIGRHVMWPWSLDGKYTWMMCFSMTGCVGSSCYVALASLW